jgi:DNA relaxase NicK
MSQGYAFDWYQPTVPDSAEGVLNFVRQVWPDGITRPCKPKNGAGEAFQHCLGDLVVVTAMWGGAMEGAGVNLWASGSDAPFFAEQCRKRWPVHRVTRADVAADFNGAGAWEWAYKLLTDYADRYKLDVDHQGDYHRGQRGRSVYIGSKSSPVRMVGYEKGKQIPEIGLPDLVRLELRVRPKNREAGERVCQMPPEAFFGCSRWSQDLGEYLQSGDTPERVQIGTKWNKSDHARAIAAIIRQYGGHLGQMCGDLGGWEEVGIELGRRIREAADIKNQTMEQVRRIRSGAIAGGMGAAAPHEDHAAVQ